MNRKGHIPTVILVIGSFVLVVFALFSFVSFDGKYNIESKTFSDLTDSYNFKESYARASFQDIVENAINESAGSFSPDNVKVKIIDLASTRNEMVGTIPGSVYGRLSRGDFEISQDNGAYGIVMKNVIVSSNAGGNRLTESFDLSLKFDKNGLL